MKVAIVGGGAAGLIQALLLQKKKIDVVVYEKCLERPNFKRIVGLDFRSLKTLKNLNILDEVIAIGYKIPGATVYENDKRVTSIDLTIVNDDYPFFLSISLSDLETFLEQKVLNMSKGVCVTAMNRTGKKNEITLDSGEKAEYDLVIGSDGPGSQIREMAGISVSKFDYPFYLEVANQKVEKTEERMQLFFEHGKTVHLRIPHSKTHVQVVRAIYEDIPPIDKEKTMRGENETEIKIKLDKFVAQTFLKNGVLLLGDAAHHMTPFGGRALNLAIEDAKNYAKALADGTIEKEAKKRRRVGKKVVLETHLFAKFASKGSRFLIWGFKFFDRHSKLFNKLIKGHLNITKGA